MKDSNQRKIGAMLSYISIIISSLIQLIYTPFLIKMLGQSEYGLYSLIASVIGYLTVLDLGFGNAVVVYTAKYKATNEIEKERKMQGMFKIIFYIIAIIVFVLGIVLYFSVDSLFGKAMTSLELGKAKIMMLILAFNLVITFSFNIYTSIINAYEKFVFQKIMAILNTLLKPIAMIPLLFLGYKSISMCLTITCINIFVVLSNYIYCRNKLNIKIKYNGFDKIIFKTMFLYSVWIFMNSIVDKANWSIDQFILGSVSGTVAVSIYCVASQLNILFINLSTAISGVLLPKISKMVAKNVSGKELTKEMIKVGRIQYYVIFLMASGLVLVGKNFIIYWVGKEYEQSYYVALILIIPVCFPLIQNLGLSIMQAMNKYKFKAVTTFIMAFFNVIVSYFLAKIYGPIGTAIGTAIALVVCNIILINVYYKIVIGLNIIKFWKNIIKMTLTFIPSVLLLLLFINFVKIEGILGVIVYAVLYSCIYFITCYFVTMNEYERSIINNILIKIHIKKEKV